MTGDKSGAKQGRTYSSREAKRSTRGPKGMWRAQTSEIAHQIELKSKTHGHSVAVGG